MDKSGTSPGATRVALRKKQCKEELEELKLELEKNNVLGEPLSNEITMLLVISTKINGVMALLGDLITEVTRMQYAKHSNIEGFDIDS